MQVFNISFLKKTYFLEKMDIVFGDFGVSGVPKIFICQAPSYVTNFKVHVFDLTETFETVILYTRTEKKT